MGDLSRVRIGEISEVFLRQLSQFTMLHSSDSREDHSDGTVVISLPLLKGRGIQRLKRIL